MARDKQKRSILPTLLALASLIFLIFLFGFYLENCLKKQLDQATTEESVLGVSSFNSAASKNPVINSESFNFTATVAGDQAGVLNATVLFDLTGRGVIGSNIQGPGVCLKLTDTTAVCNNADIDPNQTVVWTVPVTASSTCSQNSPPSLTLQTRLVATLLASTSTTTTGCVASTPSATSTPTPAPNNPTPTPTQNNTTTSPTNTSVNSITEKQTSTTTADNNTGSAEQATPASSANFTDFACSKVNGFPLVFILFILWLLATAYYFLLRKRN